MANTIIVNFGLSERLLDYTRTTYPNAKIIEKNETHVILDVTAMTSGQQATMKSDLTSRLVENV